LVTIKTSFFFRGNWYFQRWPTNYVPDWVPFYWSTYAKT